MVADKLAIKPPSTHVYAPPTYPILAPAGGKLGGFCVEKYEWEVKGDARSIKSPAVLTNACKKKTEVYVDSGNADAGLQDQGFSLVSSCPYSFHSKNKPIIPELIMDYDNASYKTTNPKYKKCQLFKKGVDGKADTPQMYQRMSKDDDVDLCNKKYCLKLCGEKSMKGFTPYVSFYGGNSVSPYQHWQKKVVGGPASGQSATQNVSWSIAQKIGCYGGFALFLLGYLITIIYIFVDINKRGKMYADMMVEDVAKMHQMGMSSQMEQIEAELAVRLKGVIEDGGVDDQLINNALDCSPTDYQKYM